ncbi:hypothetical protein AMTR_s00205p00021920 [Amborella trichopoda]|uniref:DUF659 domain-containing protein n=1 Tax=Amborella trichopoda TaxID=13333 RepID=W1NZI1_AMBTC|nr:hypothetical protein AMTR_s00205p00021920 [Amborella trichopoda]
MRLEESEAKHLFGSSRKDNMRSLDQTVFTSLSQYSGLTQNATRSNKRAKGNITHMFEAHGREDVDAVTARYFYAHGIPFNIVRGPQFQEKIYAINNAPKGYVPPKYERLRTRLLDKQRSQIDHELGALRNEWPTYEISIISDG